MKVSPSILSCDFARAKDDIDTILNDLDYLHIDVMDGVFVNNISIGVPVVKALRKYYDIVFDTHLMIVEPIKYIEAFAKAGADIITFHLEACCNQQDVINKIHECGKKAGISIKPQTKVSELNPYLNDVELVLVMSVEPGFGGQKFDPNALAKIKELDELRKTNGYHYEIEVDGGINEVTGKECLDNGCDVLVAGSYIFGAANRKEAIDKLRK